MDIRILKRVTFLSVILCLTAGISMYFLPNIHMQTSLLSEKEHVYTEFAMGSTEGEEGTGGQNPEDVVEKDDSMNGQLKIELPDGLGESNIMVDNSYIRQTVYVHIPTEEKDYFSNYKVKGSCEHIADLSYYQKDKEGVVALHMDKLYEIKKDFRGGSLYLDFIDPHDIYDKVVVVDAGHGGKDTGASKGNCLEKEVNLDILLQLKVLFDQSEENIGVYYTRTEDVRLSLTQRVQMANKAEADLFISIHNNASSNGQYSSLHGTEVMYSESQTGEFNSMRFSEICLDELCEKLGSKRIKLLEGDSIFIIRNSKMPVALLEVGFVTNREEAAKLMDVDYQKDTAEAIYNSVIKAFKEGF